MRRRIERARSINRVNISTTRASISLPGFCLLPSLPNRPRPCSRPLVRAVGIEKAAIDRTTDQLIPLTCMEVEDENDDEDENENENDWGRKDNRNLFLLAHCLILFFNLFAGV
jgi:hypothetical protein